MIFPSLRQSLEYAVSRLIPRRHLYIIDVYGGERLCKEKQSAVQIVDQEHVFKDGELGLTLHLSFDARTCADFYARFLALPPSISDKFTAVPYRGIPCFAVTFGTDIEAAVQLTHAILSTVYFNADAMDLQYELLDLGEWDEYFARLRQTRHERRS